MPLFAMMPLAQSRRRAGRNHTNEAIAGSPCPDRSWNRPENSGDVAERRRGRGDMQGSTRREPIRRSASDARREALFVSALQPSDAPTADVIAGAIMSAMHRFGPGGCAARMAQEFGDHPDAAAARMRWARKLAA